ncbi:MAG: hypothetical protein DRR16_04350 [Candidatus Parabeggiatoa sp. nov. 3]|nr:MAG: hypothetical protein DRR00_18055 [Gammaproteobacteria bacterium]RKZ64899.1 MAG: hypothetical protein DRQ99_14280 [Gammaproteobacteria bacterium]RKZ88676.1 MAG: hypothetical protein DRR16_04350 [Gammaproteobacteria bacterium]
MATLQEKYGLLKGLFMGDGTAYIGPFYAAVDITRRCNLHCMGCRYHSTAMKTIPLQGEQNVLDMSFDLFKHFCDELQTMGTSSLTLIGEGEPLLHPRIFDMIATAKDAGLFVTLLTNGTLLNERRCQSLIDSRLDSLKVSLWGSSKNVYKLNFPEGKHGNFEKIINSLRCLSSIKAARKSKWPAMTLHHPINRNNFQHIEAMINLVHTTGCNALSFSPFHTNRGQLASMALSSDEELQVCFVLSQMTKRLNALGIKHNIAPTLFSYRIGEKVWQTFPCYAGWLQLRLKMDGNLLPCYSCHQPLGNLNERSLHDIWNSAALKDFRRQTITMEGLTKIGEQCDCAFCCHLNDNWRVHRLFRWISPTRAIKLI